MHRQRPYEGRGWRGEHIAGLKLPTRCAADAPPFLARHGVSTCVLPVKPQDGRSGAAQDDSPQLYRMAALLSEAASKAMGALHHLMKRQHSNSEGVPLTPEQADAVLAILARALPHLRHSFIFAVRRVRRYCHGTACMMYYEILCSLCSMHWCTVRFVKCWSWCAVDDIARSDHTPLQSAA